MQLTTYPDTDPERTRAATATMQVSYDPVYDGKSNSLDIVACSDGENGLESLGAFLRLWLAGRRRSVH